jgi:hypothetical protein
LTPSQVVSLTTALDNVQSIHDAIKCLTDDKNPSGISRFGCASTQILSLVTKFKQQRQIVGTLLKFGINKDITAIVDAAIGFPTNALQAGISFDVFLATTALKPDSGAAIVNLFSF